MAFGWRLSWRAGGGGGTISRMAHDPPGRTHAGQVTPRGEQWQVDGGAAELYQRYLVPAVTAGWAAGLVDRVGLRGGERVLDVACGTGVVARAAAKRVGRAGRVAGIDINAAMLGVARALPARRGGQDRLGARECPELALCRGEP